MESRTYLFIYLLEIGIQPQEVSYEHFCLLGHPVQWRAAMRGYNGRNIKLDVRYGANHYGVFQGSMLFPPLMRKINSTGYLQYKTGMHNITGLNFVYLNAVDLHSTTPRMPAVK